jgi:hypothetical protein
MPIEGITASAPAPEPSRSAKYTRAVGRSGEARSRPSTRPENVNGIAYSRASGATRRKAPRNSRREPAHCAPAGAWAKAAETPTIEIAKRAAAATIASLRRRRSACCQRVSKTPETANPSIVSETTRKARLLTSLSETSRCTSTWA